MSNPNKQKGTAAETKVVRYLQAAGLEAQRRALAGSKDQGDIEYTGVSPLYSGKKILEVKCGKQTANYSRGKKNEWLKQTQEEAINSQMDAHLVILIHNHSIKDAEVWNAEGNEFYFFDDFVKRIGGINE